MSKLSPVHVEEYFSTHLPYRTRILVAHHMMSREPWHGNAGQLDACFIASLVSGRVFLNALGIGKTGKLGPTLTTFNPQPDDLIVSDLGGRSVDIGTLSGAEKDMLLGFIVMADKAGAHLTKPLAHDLNHYDEGIVWLCKRLKTHLYDAAGRAVSVDIAAVLVTLPK